MRNPEVGSDNQHEFLVIAPEEIVIDEHVRLKTLQPTEAVKMFQAIEDNREELGKWLPWVDSTQSSRDSEKFIKEARGKREHMEEAPYGIFFNGEFAGHVSLMARGNRTGEIGYWLDKKMYGNGLVTKSAARLVELGFGEMGCSRILILAEEDNDASQAVARRLGFDEQKTVQKDGKNLIKFELKKDEQ